MVRRLLYPIRPTGVTICKYLCGCCRLHRCRQVLTSWEETLGAPQLRNSAFRLASITRYYVTCWMEER